MYPKLIFVVLFSSFLFQYTISANHPSFAQWKSQVGKNYASHTEEKYRAYIYAKNVQRIEQNNNDPSLTHKEAVNKFTDITPEQFKLTYLTFVPLAKSGDDDGPIVRGSDQDDPIVRRSDEDDHPIVRGSDQDDPIVRGSDEDDHPIVRKQGKNLIITSQKDDDTPIVKVTAVNWSKVHPEILIEDQGVCGSCYAFTAMTITSFAVKMQYNETNVFSKQELVDCSKKYGNNGCDGGNMAYCYKYGRKYKIQSQSDYPYTVNEGNCKRDSAKAGKYRIASYKNYMGCKKMYKQIQKSPLAVAVDASNWSAYSSGVFTTCEQQVNHAVSLVGVTAEGEWIIMNSWGVQWGQQGYITLAKENTCGICNYSGSFVALSV